MDKPLSIEEASNRLPELVERAAAGEPIEIRDGDRWVTLVDAGFFETLEILSNPEDVAAIKRLLEQAARGEFVNVDDLR